MSAPKWCAIPAVSDVHEFVALRGAYKRIRNGDQHSFVEVFHRGDVARILINEDKHLQGQAKVNFNELPLFEREQYEDLERALRSYSYFHDQVRLLRKPYQSDFAGYHEYVEAAESALYFVSTHCSPVHDQRAKDAFAQLWTDQKGYIERREVEGDVWPGARGQLLQRVLDEADQEYRSLLFKSIGSQTNFIENFMPEVIKTDEVLGEDFATQTRERCAPWGYDEDLLKELSETSTTSRVVRIDYKKDDPTRSVPFHIEEAVLDAMRIPRDRPLMSIIGGARFMEQEGVNSLSSMSEQVLAVAHKHTMNVAVPGTQSGIGTTFGRENLRYKQATAHLPHADKAHLFAISPGGNTDFPGNPYLDPAHKQQIYAMTPVDSIMTPFL